MKNTLTSKSALIYMQPFIESPIIMSISTLNNGRCIEVNKAFFKILGYDREETIDRTSSELGVWG